MLGPDHFGFVFLKDTLVLDSPLIRFSVLGEAASSLPSSLALDQVLIVETPIFAGEEIAVLLVVLTVASEGFQA
jgi:hypothetical protein